MVKHGIHGSIVKEIIKDPFGCRRGGGRDVIPIPCALLAWKMPIVLQWGMAVKTSKSGLSLGKAVKFDRNGLSTKLLIILCVCFLVGAVLGGGGLYLLTKNDSFEMVAAANQEVDLVIGGEEKLDHYVELGVKCVAFNKDITDDVKITYLYREDITHDTKEVDTVDPNTAGIYYVVYTSSNFKYRNVQLVRNVIVLGAEE